MSKIAVLGPGVSSLDYKPHPKEKTLAFQEVFPNCINHLNIVPDYWTFTDPIGSISGFKHLIDMIDKTNKFDKMIILVPNIFFEDFSIYRMYFGTTPLMKVENGWKDFQNLLCKVEKHYNVKKVPVTTTKYIKLYEKSRSELKNIFTNEYTRFMSEKIIFGTVEYDSERVFGNINKWGLENKLTSSILPICYYLRAKEAKIYGFDYAGPRFYDDNSRHPWSNIGGKIDSRVEYSLSLIKKWLQWADIHGINIVSGTNRNTCLANRYLEYKEYESS